MDIYKKETIFNVVTVKITERSLLDLSKTSRTGLGIGILLFLVLLLVHAHLEESLQVLQLQPLHSEYPSALGLADLLAYEGESRLVWWYRIASSKRMAWTLTAGEERAAQVVRQAADEIPLALHLAAVVKPKSPFYPVPTHGFALRPGWIRRSLSDNGECWAQPNQLQGFAVMASRQLSAVSVALVGWRSVLRLAQLCLNLTAKK